MQSQVQMVPCQNKFGNNARIFGGTHGMAEAVGAATENQGIWKGSGLLADPYVKKWTFKTISFLNASRPDCYTIVLIVQECVG